MNQVIASFLFFGLFVFIHIAGFRLRFVKFQSTVFMVLSLLCLMIYISSVLLLPGLWGGSLFATSILLYSLLCLCYISQSIVLQYGSPSMTIIDAAWKGNGISYEELKTRFSNEHLILSRLDDLVSHGLAKYENDRYYIQPRGNWVVQFIKAYRQLLGRPLGG